MPRFISVLTAVVFVAASVMSAGGRAAYSAPEVASPLPIGSPSASPAPFDDPVANTAAQKISRAQISALINGLFTRGSSLKIDRRPLSPGSSPKPPIYEGTQSDGKQHLATDGGLACLHFAPHTEMDEADCFGALLSIAADGGSAGADLKLAYDKATDKQAFARALGRALQLLNESEEAKSEADIAFMRTLPIGAKRSDVYTELRGRKIVVYNNLFNPGKAQQGGGCDYDATRQESAYPMFGEPLPPNVCGPQFPRMTDDYKAVTVAPKSPSATADFDLGFDLACGYEKYVRLDFDQNDRLSDVDVSPERHTCL
jgi:hypothetical protein